MNKANLEGANLCDADLINVHFISANLRGANLRNADLTGANFSRVDLTNANLTDAKSVIHELALTVPHARSIPVQPLILSSQEEYAMFEFIKSFESVCETYRYDSQETLLANLEEKVIGPAERKVIELKGRGR